MTGQELINYIVENHLENEPIYTSNGILVGWMTSEEAAAQLGVKESLIRVWVNEGWIDGVRSNDNLIVPKSVLYFKAPTITEEQLYVINDLASDLQYK